MIKIFLIKPINPQHPAKLVYAEDEDAAWDAADLDSSSAECTRIVAEIISGYSCRGKSDDSITVIYHDKTYHLVKNIAQAI